MKIFLATLSIAISTNAFAMNMPYRPVLSEKASAVFIGVMVLLIVAMMFFAWRDDED